MSSLDAQILAGRTALGGSPHGGGLPCRYTGYELNRSIDSFLDSGEGNEAGRRGPRSTERRGQLRTMTTQS